MTRWLPNLVLAAVLAGCTQFFFQPHRHRILTPETFGLAYQEVRFRTDDGFELLGWFLPAQGDAAGTILFLHGNAENISTHISAVAWLPAQGFNVFLVDYRGYGASEGNPSLAGAEQDIDAAMRTLLARSDIDTNRIVVYGQSLGGALAAYNVAYSPYRDHVRALVIESAFSSYTGITREKLAATWLTWPFQWLASLTVDESFSPLPAMTRISPIPLLVIHGDQDAIVPDHHGKRLYDAALEPRQLWIIPGAGHIQGMRQEMWRDRFVAYLRGVLK
ncbi:MAG TPA: alpha/beta hydrolase [Burkholderiales bacterium]|nr:alpha/beta hydrolase [Burkholderiales bacterium]